MKWLKRLFARATHDPLASLRREPTFEEVMAERQRWQEEDRWDALRDGEHVLSAWTNVAPGTRGYSLRWLELDGYMTCEMQRPLRPDSGPRYVYRLTRKGRDKLAALSEPAK